MLERLQKLENRIENVEENCSLISSEQVVTKEKMERVYNVVQTHGNILHEIEQKKQYADVTKSNGENVRANTAGSHMTANGAKTFANVVGGKLTGTNQNTLGTVVKQNPGSWKKVENKRKRTVVVGTNTAAVRVHGAPPPIRDLVIERVAQYTSEHDIKEYIEENGV